ncbi:tRNA (adenosine(37)-N6)-threonylcarbamoyltransferase complex dimerization subunit type 1 TsaB [Desulfosporosinus sp.]|uniref:tRNA (adenosine(37)-N6)-threonylcarbamoyltransferase complex dimerization subunit type 1 TsaB n=1 Tax=Desulfosporosinus sp. TaxID=157907 RepID=UPI000E94828F|nr:tRNA (adenosine(37)-N6)-threonylcarbamoyltransferase complex dimerization subunit type 1 TsaB [Desulfosporosinus sp.]MBC2721464.1 tRNA (adenosine(37)-N6)-threonylcarbamoyltransferase complex dimerization subunit type 1 TsaB [Desulfosporosinus sp.]MBC2727519.1 tRNA (adenosine(37)-N6)-threonylcarbamoyltransferase complex dimerization subunit type 1 TsaB [Desulfosporosinus sp.]HBV87749.1 tRNA (adenosine(37)-N6)-threonylcarbamoyltransferase complex dimerization subunit type 1 TsaB [Desulfosporosi
MKYLTIDTTTKVTAVALAEDEKLVGEGFLHTTKTHSERIIPMLDQLLNAAAWKLQDLDMIGVVRGPGSFTGIRIGIATAQGLAQVLKIPIISVVSLDALAWAGKGRTEDIVPILDARKNEWYTGRYRWIQGVEKPECLTSPQAMPTGQWLEFLWGLDRPICFVGDAVGKAKGHIEQVFGDRAVILPEYACLPRGAYAVEAVWQRWLQTGKGELVEPYYIRFSEAEVNWAKKEKARRSEGHE